MRIPERLSYSSFSLWEKQPDEFYLKYLSDHRPPRIPQERPAAAGSAFDAKVKAFLFRDLFGNTDPKYTFEALFEAQVEPQNRDWALPVAEHIVSAYELSGFYDSLLALLKESKTPPRFEFTVNGEINGVPFTGKPDLQFTLDVPVVHDFKVNGYCSKNAVSPHKSYRLCRDGFVGKQSKSHDTQHKEYLAYDHHGFEINTSYLEVSNAAWADQLSCYGWVLDEKIGDENVVLSIHQIVAKPSDPPQLRVAEFRARVKSEYQITLSQRLRACWDAINNNHVFTVLTKEESVARCQVLDDTAVGLLSDGSSRENWFNEATRERYCG
jgi:hypothetical protein